MSEEIQWTMDDLKSFALTLCLHFYENYSEQQANALAPLAYRAWTIGREITILNGSE